MKQKRERAKRRTQSLGYFFPGESINSEAEFALDRLKVLLLSKTLILYCSHLYPFRTGVKPLVSLVLRSIRERDLECSN